MTNYLNWGIFSTANIARKALIPALALSKTSNLLAVASRDHGKAQRYLDDLPSRDTFPELRAYGSYEALLADDDIDVIYNPTPNHLHVSLTVEAIRAGKHVLCEKPIALNQLDAQALIEVCKAHPDIKVMEAFMYRFHPQWVKAKSIVEAGTIGAIQHIDTHFSYTNLDPNNVRNKGDIGGGGLLDIGCYAISVARWIYGQTPQAVTASQTFNEDFGTDIHTSALMEFEAGATSSFFCSTQSQPKQSVEILGEKGRIRIEVPFNPEPSVAAIIRVTIDGVEEVLEFENANHYLQQVDVFANAIREGNPVPTGLDDALENMRVIDAIFSSAKMQKRVSL